MAKKKQIINDHHEVYGQESVGAHREALLVRLRKGEHLIATWVKRWCAKNVSIQFIHWLRYTAARLEMDRSITKIDLDKEL